MFDEGRQSAELEKNAAGRATRWPEMEACPACGASVRRKGARFCATCGRSLERADYFPTDALKASYHRPPARPITESPRPAATRTQTRFVKPPRPRPRPRQKSVPFNVNRNGASTTAMAFVTYALVPYLGIIFCPGALLMGGIGLVRARRTPHDGGQRTSIMSIALGLLLFCAQLLLWWILYKVPEWSQRAPF